MFDGRESTVARMLEGIRNTAELGKRRGVGFLGKGGYKRGVLAGGQRVSWKGRKERCECSSRRAWQYLMMSGRTQVR